MKVETFELAPGYVIPRILRGGWQLAGDHGEVDRERAIADMAQFVAAGINTFDCADIYTGVEAAIGEYRRRDPSLQVHTKFVPDLEDLPHVDEAYVRRINERSRERLNAEALDLVQFHWWDYEVDGMLRVAKLLAKLQREGAIRHLGGTNFDTPRTQHMLDAGVPLVSMQVQYSLLDRRPAGALSALCARTPLRLLCYGTIAGGFITETWLGQPEPAQLTNRSLIKYKLVIDDFGGWPAFQRLLQLLKRIATKHGVGLSAVATRWVLDQPHVAAAIVGARYAAHLPEQLQVFAFRLDDADRHDIAALLADCPGPDGDTYTLERDRNGRHGRIMKYNLNKT
ncbi:MAG TPA: aldo/keto reductase [Ramlibacter sp.]|nr:aldo/keto reductase [Ramlibacter sp.]